MQLSMQRRGRVHFLPLLAACAIVAAAPAACVKLPRRAPAGVTQVTNDPPTSTPTDGEQPAAPRVNVNAASAGELERLPGVGPVLAARIVEHRERYGPFRRVEHLLAVRGISERRFRDLRPHVTAQ